MKPSEKLVSVGTYIAGILTVACALLLVVLITLAELGCIHPRKIRLVVETDTVIRVYDGTPLTGGIEITYGELVAGHELKILSQSSITKTGTIRNEIDYLITDKTGVDVTDRYNIKEETGTLTVIKRSICVESEGISKTYDGMPLQSDKITLASGESLGIGDQIKTISSPSLTKPGSVDNKIVFQIVSADGKDVTDQYKVTPDWGVLRISPRRLWIETASATKYYDGVPLEREDYTIKSGSLADGQTLQLVENTSLNAVGTVKNELKFTICDVTGADVTDCYQVTSRFGNLQINLRTLVIQTGSASKYCDGTPLQCDDYTIKSGSLADGHKVQVLDGTSLEEAGKVGNQLKLAVYDAAGADVTSYYEIQQRYGTLVVTRRSLLIESGSANKYYDGAPLRCDDYTIKSGSLANGHTVQVLDGTTLEAAGTVKNELKLAVYDEKGADVTSYYDIQQRPGTLTIRGIALTIITGSASKIYDGTPLSNESWTLKAGSVVSGHTLSVIETAGFDGVGSVDNIMRFAVTDAKGNDVTNRYEITYVYGTLSVQPRKISIQMGSGDKAYDGKPLTNHTYTLLSGSLCKGHTLTVVGKTRTEVGFTYNDVVSYAITVKDAAGVEHDVSDCYQLTYTSGRLTVTSAR